MHFNQYVSSHKNGSFRSHQTCKTNDQNPHTVVQFYEVLIILLHITIQTANFSLYLFTLIYASLRHVVQMYMFSQISHIPNLIRKF